MEGGAAVGTGDEFGERLPARGAEARARTIQVATGLTLR